MADYSKMRGSYYVYGVQISKLGDYGIITNKYNFRTKAEAVLWAAKMVKKGQYATVVKFPNKYYRKASEYVSETLPSVLAYERGEIVGQVRLLPAGIPVIVDTKDAYMYFISNAGRAVGKTRSIWKDATKR